MRNRIHNCFIHGDRRKFGFVCKPTIWASQLVDLEERRLVNQRAEVAQLLGDRASKLFVKAGGAAILIVDG